MSIKLKAGKTFTPDAVAQFGDSIINSDYAGKIVEVEYNVEEKRCFFTVIIHCTHAEHNYSVAQRINFNFTGDDFDTSIGENGITISDAETLALITLTDWEQA